MHCSKLSKKAASSYNSSGGVTMRTLLQLACMLLFVTLGTTASCDRFQKWGTATTIDSLAGYKLGTAQSAVDLSQFTFPLTNAFKNPEAQVTINGVSFKASLTLGFTDQKLTQVRIVSENISSDELKKLESAAYQEISKTYSKNLVKFRSDSYDLRLEDAAGNKLELATRETTIADNDGVFDYGITAKPASS
jgi:hypothetical protein